MARRRFARRLPSVEPLEKRAMLAVDALQPLGSLIYHSVADGDIAVIGEVDRHDFALNAGQTIAIQLLAQANLQAEVQVLDPSGIPIATASAAAAGDAVIVPPAAVMTEGTYSVTVAGALASMDSYSLNLVLNAAIELEIPSGGTNDTLQTAESLDDSFIALPGGAERGAVHNSFITQPASQFTDVDWYRFSLNDGQSATLVIDAANFFPRLALYDANANLLAEGISATSSKTQVIHNFLDATANAAADDYFIRVSDAVNYRLVVTRDAAFDIEDNNGQNAAQQISAAHAALGYLNSTDTAPDDWYTVSVNAGDSLSVETFTPIVGPNDPANLLDVKLELLDPTGAMVAADDNSGNGNHALLNHSVITAGDYRLRVAAVSDAGEYFVRVSGATGDDPTPRVKMSTVADGARFNTFPTTVTLDFSEALLAGTIDASDLIVGGLPATGITKVDSDTLRFNVNPAANTGQGSYQIELPAGAVSDLQGNVNSRFTASFVLDTTPPTMTAALFNGNPLPANNSLAAGALVFTGTFSEPMRTDRLDLSDVSLIDLATSQTIGVTQVSANEAGDQVTVTIDTPLPDGHYRLTLKSGASRFEDVAGNALDGEPLGAGAGGVPTGNGAAGGDYAVSFYVDSATIPAVAFDRVNPLGSLIASSENNRASIYGGGDLDVLTFAAQAGETVSAIARDAFANATLTIEIVGLSGMITAAAAGQPVAISSVTIPADGTYELRVGGDVATTYIVDIFRNAAWEDESSGGSANDLPSQAQSIDDLFKSLASGTADRAAVVAREPLSIEADDFESGALDGQWSTYSGAAEARAYVTNAYGAAGGQYALFMDRSVQLGINTLIEAIWTVDLSGHDEAILSFFHIESQDEEHALPADFVDHANGDGVSISDDGVHWHTVLNAVGAFPWIPVEIDLGAEARAAGMTLGANFQIKFQEYDDSEFPFDGRAYDQIAIRGGDVDWYQFTLVDGQSASVVVDGAAAVVDVYDASGVLLAAGIAADNATQQINGLIDTTNNAAPDVYFARVESTNPYRLVVTRDVDFEREANNQLDTAQQADGALGFVNFQATSGATVMAEFPGIDRDHSFCDCEPPDTHAASGPNHVVEVVNAAIQIWDKNGQPSGPSRSLLSFFDASLVGDSEFDFDPVVAYMEDVDHWVVGELVEDTEAGGETDFLVAISDSSDPTGTWSEQHRIDFGGLNPGMFIDYPKVGWNADALVFTFNAYEVINRFSNAFRSVTLLAIDKSTLTDADSGTLTHFLSERPNTSFTMAPATMHGSAPGDPMWLVEESQRNTLATSVRVVRMDKVLSTAPSFSDTTLPVTGYQSGTMPPPPQPGGQLNAGDGRFLNAEWRDDRLVAVHHANVSGVTKARWYEFDTSGAVPVLSQEGTIDPGPGVATFYPSIAINAAGDIGLTFMQSSNTEYASMYVTGQAFGAASGSTAAPTLIKAGEQTYRGGRAGDYSGITVDPVNDTFWAANEVILSKTVGSQWGTHIGQFTVAPVKDVDNYRISVNAGDVLTAATFTPLDAAGLPVNALDPTLKLFAPDGTLVAMDDNSAGDGKNASLAHTALQTGEYRLQVAGVGNSAGEYVVQIGGATGDNPGPAAVASQPNPSEIVSPFPTVFTLHFSEPVLLSSVQASDLLFGGLPATGVVAIDGDTLEFTLDPAADLGDGQYAVAMAAGAVSDFQGGISDAYSGTFTVDITGPKIISTQWNGGGFPADAVFAAGSLTVEAVFDESLFTLRSARTGLKTPGVNAVKLLSYATNEVLSPDSVNYNPTTLTFQAVFDDLTEGSYTLIFLSGDGEFEDQLGNDLDGEASGPGLDGAPTGDDIAGGDYAIDFYVDGDTQPANEFERLIPLGGLISASFLNTAFLHPTDSDGFTFYATAGETISAHARPDSPDATLSIQLVGITGQSTATTAGGTARLFTARIPTDGMYEIQVNSDLETAVNLQIFRNTTLESADTNPAAPRAIDGSLFDAGWQRWAVLGSSNADVDQYTLDLTGRVGHRVDVVLTGLDEFMDSDTLQLIGPDGTTVLATAVADPVRGGDLSQTFDLGILNFVVPSNGVYRIRLTSATPSLYTIVVFDGAAIESENNDTSGDAARGLNAQGRGVGYVIASDLEWRIFDNANDFYASPNNFLVEDFELGYFNGDDIQFCNSPINSDSDDLCFLPDQIYPGLSLQDYPGPDADELVIVQAGFFGNESIIAGTAYEEESLDLLFTDQDVTAVGMDVWSVEDSTYEYTVFGLDGSILQTGSFDVFEGSPTFFGLVSPQVIASIRLSSPSLEFVDNVAFGQFVSDVDRWQVSLAAGEIVSYAARPLLDNPAHSPLNDLDATLTVIGPDGTSVIATDQDSLDGRNPLVFFIAPQAGVYTIEVSANSGGGEYQLLMNPPDTITPPLITSASVVQVPENTTAVLTIQAIDIDLPPQTLTFSIVGGTDQGRFSLTSGGLLEFVTPPDFENPTDADSDNVYDVIVEASDGNGGLTSQAISVIVTDSIAPALNDGVLSIEGSPTQDAIIVWLDAGNVLRVVQWRGDVDGTEHPFPLADVANIYVDAGDGDDLVFIARNVPVATFLDGGDGNNFLRGHNRSNLIVGGNGFDLIVGGNARDVLIGGDGFDLVSGGGEDDVLIGGSTENTRDELLSLFNSWAYSGDSFAVRADIVRQVARPIGPAGFNLLFGGAGQNLTLTPPPINGGGAALGNVVGGGASGGSTPSLWNLLATIPSLIATNPINPADINGDGNVTALDVIASINDVNLNGSRSLFVFADDPAAPGVCNLAAAKTAAEFASHCNVRGRGNLFLDASLDDLISPLDTLMVINAINAAAANAKLGQGEAEGHDGSTALESMFAADSRLAPAGPVVPAPPASFVEIAVPSDQVSRVTSAVAMIAKHEQLLRNIAATSETEADWNTDLLDLLARDIRRPSPQP